LNRHLNRPGFIPLEIKFLTGFGIILPPFSTTTGRYLQFASAEPAALPHRWHNTSQNPLPEQFPSYPVELKNRLLAAQGFVILSLNIK
jgi:hypothetical protein